MLLSQDTKAGAVLVVDDNPLIGGLFDVGTDEEFSNAASQSLPLLSACLHMPMQSASSSSCILQAGLAARCPNRHC
jgi:hypothetical protein